MAFRGTLIWDFDGTLATRSFSWVEAFLAALDKVHPGHGVTPAEIVFELNTKFPWHMPEDETVLRVDTHIWWQRMEEFFVGIFVRLGFTEGVGEMARIVHQLAVRPDDYLLLPGALDVLQACQEQGWNQVVLSNHMPDLPDMAAALGLSPYISTFYTSASMGFSKPHPLLFRKVLSELPSAEEIWMIGDSYEADIIGATGVGIPAILIGITGGLHTYEVASLVDVMGIIGRLS